jgi:hypothetical protein
VKKFPDFEGNWKFTIVNERQNKDLRIIFSPPREKVTTIWVGGDLTTILFYFIEI